MKPAKQKTTEFIIQAYAANEWRQVLTYPEWQLSMAKDMLKFKKKTETMVRWKLVKRVTSTSERKIA